MQCNSVSAHVRALCKAPPAAYQKSETTLDVLHSKLQEAAAHKQALAEAADSRGGRSESLSHSLSAFLSLFRSLSFSLSLSLFLSLSPILRVSLNVFA